MKTHKAALAMPEMSKDDFAKLKADIGKHGLLCPIETLNNEVIDGRHRLKACTQLGIEPELIEANLNGQTPAEYVWSLNAERRHLTASQRAAVAAILWPAEKKKAGRPKKQSVKNDALKSRNEAAKEVGVSYGYVSDAAKLKREAPKLFNEVKQGTKTLQQAKREAAPKRRKRSEKYPLSTAVFKMMENITAASAMVQTEYNDDIEVVLTHKDFDPDKQTPVAQMILGLSETLSTWKKSCNTIIKKNSAGSTTSTTKLTTAKEQRQKK